MVASPVIGCPESGVIDKLEVPPRLVTLKTAAFADSASSRVAPFGDERPARRSTTMTADLRPAELPDQAGFACASSKDVLEKHARGPGDGATHP